MGIGFTIRIFQREELLKGVTIMDESCMIGFCWNYEVPDSVLKEYLETIEELEKSGKVEVVKCPICGLSIYCPHTNLGIFDLESKERD